MPPVEFTLLKQPHEQQRKFLDCTAPEALFGGAKRGGKGTGLCMLAILLSYYFPGNKVVLARKDFTDLWDSTLSEFWQVCPSQLYDTNYGKHGHHRGERTIRLKTMRPGISSDIVYRGLGEWDDIEKAKSLNAGAFLIDEASEIVFDTYKMLRAQLTWVLPDGTRPAYMMRITSNPEPCWVKDRFITNPPQGCVFIPSLPRENPFLPPGWEDELRRDTDPEWVEKYLDGSWDVAEGSTFPELNLDTHAIQPIDTAPYGLIGSIDHAASGITAFLLCGIDDNGNIIALHEHYEKDKLISYHAQKIKEVVAMYCPKVEPPLVRRKLRYLLIDPSTNARTQQGHNKLQSIADVYREAWQGDDEAHELGLNPVPAWNAVEAGLQRIKNMLHVNPLHIHPTKPDIIGGPSIQIVKRFCPNLWKEMREHRKVIMPSGEIKYVGADHALDDFRYIVNSRPKPQAGGTSKDQSRRPLQDQFATRAHDKWAAKFDRTTRPNPLFIGA